MKRFTSPGHAQRFLSAFSGISPHFRPRRHRLAAEQYRREMAVRFTTWNEVTGLATAASGLRQSHVIMAGCCGDTPRLAFPHPGW
jgi:hypothetical protein